MGEAFTSFQKKKESVQLVTEQDEEVFAILDMKKNRRKKSWEMRVRILEREFQESPIMCMPMLWEGREPPEQAAARKALHQTWSSSIPVVKEKTRRTNG